MRTTRLGATLLLALTVGGTACNNGDAPVPFVQLPARVGSAFCSFASRCGIASSLVPGLLGSTLTDCDAQTTLYFANTTFAQYDLAIRRGTIVYHPDAAGRCLAAFDAMSCAGFGSGGPAACNETFVGTVADGGACTFGQECSRTSTCSGGGMGTACGMCAHVPQIGEACGTGPAMTCAVGAFCSSTNVCTAAIAAGGACDPSMGSVCAAGLTCVPSTPMGRAGTCMMPTTTGMLCGTMTCQPGQVCALEGGMRTCRAPRTDGTCGAVLNGSDCSATTMCDPMTMRCVPYPTLGQACTNVCLAPARCVNRMCQPAGDILATCTSNDACVSRNCAMGTCAAPPLCTP